MTYIKHYKMKEIYIFYIFLRVHFAAKMRTSLLTCILLRTYNRSIEVNSQWKIIEGSACILLFSTVLSDVFTTKWPPLADDLCYTNTYTSP